MAIAFVAKLTEGHSTTYTTTTVDTSGGNFLVAYVSENSAGGVTGITDNKSNSFTALTDQFVGAPGGRMFYAKNATCGTLHTFTVTMGGTDYANVCVAAFSGVDTTAPADQQNGFSSAGYAATTVQPGSITPSVDNCLVVTGIGTQDGSSASINGGFTITDFNPTSGGNFWGSGMAYLIQTTAAAANPTWTSSVEWHNLGISIESFKSSAGGGAPALHLLTTLGAGN